ncbi:MFS transporter [Xanthobacter sp. V4C-4]|uniref:MFS transporter n=1 Tax=Xanthobacter cornucopiae TaxID=3119924 RepID=UPI0037273EFC
MGVPSSPAAGAGPKAVRLALLALALASFGIGTTEFVIVGLLPNVAADLGVSIPEAGFLVTGYALSVTFGSPFLAIATARMNRRHALMLLMGVFIAGNLLCALAPSFWLLMGARIVTALCHGAFFGLGAVVAAELSPPSRKAQAIAMMFAGLTIANVLGVPLGTAMGEMLSWRDTFLAVVVIGVIAALALAVWLPRHLPAPRLQLKREAKAIGSPQVMLAMLISVIASSSLFTVFTYIAPILTSHTGVSAHGVTLMLLVFGIGLTVGNFGGGWLADRSLMPTVIGITAVLVVLLAVFPLATAHPLPAALTLAVWGALAFALVAPLQMRVVKEAADAPNLASTLNQGAFNLGNAIGAGIGGVGLTLGLGYMDLPWIGASLSGLALLLAIISHRLDQAAQPVMAAAVAGEEPGPLTPAV